MTPDPDSPRSGNRVLPEEPFQLNEILESNYILEGELDRGAQGRVLKATDRRLRRTVAIKELVGTGDSIERRFEREALITARLQHPAIVNIHEAGRWPNGRPFYVMQLVEGLPLNQVVESRTTLSSRLGLLSNIFTIVEAMAYAHRQGVIHRDLKPMNILVGAFGETVVIDWGLAKDLSHTETDSEVAGETVLVDAGENGDPMATIPDSEPGPPGRGAALTMAGGVLGTPAYMPPEQARGKPVDERSDVYALGSILYYVLAGRPAYAGDSNTAVLKQVIQGPPKPLETVQTGIPHDLLAIVKKAMARDPRDRYPTAKELAAELRRFQTGQLVAAHSYTSRELMSRWLKRHRAAVLVAAASLVILGFMGSLGLDKIIQARNRAEIERVRAADRADELTLVQARSWLDRSPITALAWLKALSPASTRWPAARLIAEQAQDSGVHKVFTGHQGMVWDAVFSPDGTTIASGSEDQTVRVWNCLTGTVRTLEGHKGWVKDVAFSPDGTMIASASQDGTIRIWNLRTGGSRVFSGHDDFVTRIAFLPGDGGLVSASLDGNLRIWDLESGASRILDAHHVPLQGMAISPDGTHIASAGFLGVDDGSAVSEIQVWDVATGTGSFAVGQERVDRVLFSPDGTKLVSSGQGPEIRFWDLTTGDVKVLTGHRNSVTATAFTSDGTLLVSSSLDGTLGLWDPETGTGRFRTGHDGEVLHLAISPDNRRIASAGVDHTIRIWNVDDEETRVLRGHDDWVLHVEFSADGTQLVSCGRDRTVRLWDIRPPKSKVLRGHQRDVLEIVYSPDGRYLATSGFDPVIRLWDAASGSCRVLQGHQGVVRHVAFSPDGRHLASAGGDKSVRLWDVETGESREFLGHEGSAEVVCFSPRGDLLASGSLDSTIRVWDPSGGTHRVFGGHENKVSTLDFSPDGKYLASGSSDNTVRIWDMATAESRVFDGHHGWIRQVRFSPRGDLIASAGADGTIRLWTLDGHSRELLGHEGWVKCIAFSPDGTQLVSGGSDDLVRIWEVESGLSQALAGHSGDVEKVAFSPDGATVASASTDGTVRLWDVATGMARTMRAHPGGVTGVAFSPDGSILGTCGLDNMVRLWWDELPRDAEGLRAWLDQATNAVIGPDSEVGYRISPDAPDPD